MIVKILNFHFILIEVLENVEKSRPRYREVKSGRKNLYNLLVIGAT